MFQNSLEDGVSLAILHQYICAGYIELGLNRSSPEHQIICMNLIMKVKLMIHTTETEK